MTIDEAIEREDALAYSFGERWKRLGEPVGDLPRLEQEHRQMAEWLKELKAYRKGIEKIKEQISWIPVSERLPKAGEYIGDVSKYYLVQNEFGDMMVARYTHSEYWEQMYQRKSVDDDIVAWQPLPEPYKAESEEI